MLETSAATTVVSIGFGFSFMISVVEKYSSSAQGVGWELRKDRLLSSIRRFGSVDSKMSGKLYLGVVGV